MSIRILRFLLPMYWYRLFTQFNYRHTKTNSPFMRITQAETDISYIPFFFFGDVRFAEDHIVYGLIIKNRFISWWWTPHT